MFLKELTTETQRTQSCAEKISDTKDRCPLNLSCISVILLLGATCVCAQTPADAKKPAESTESKTTQAPPVEVKLPVTIVLAGGSQLLVDEVSESSDGYWYKRGNVTTFLDRVRVARIEYPKTKSESENSESSGPLTRWTLAEAAKVKEFFLSKFNRPLPLSNFGQSDLHTRWGLDHRNSMDVNLHPDSVEGRALVEFLKAESIPFLAFRGPIPGVSTGPHIHVGNRSPRTYGR